jgi:hypothetical protein
MRDSSETQCAISNDAGTEKRGGLHIRHGVRQLVDEAFGGYDQFRIAAIDAIACEVGGFAKVLSAPRAEATDSAGAMQPSDAYTRSRREPAGFTARRFYRADNLVSGNNRLFAPREFSFDDVKIGPADGAGPNAEENVRTWRLRVSDVGVPKR